MHIFVSVVGAHTSTSAWCERITQCDIYLHTCLLCLFANEGIRWRKTYTHKHIHAFTHTHSCGGCLFVFPAHKSVIALSLCTVHHPMYFDSGATAIASIVAIIQNDNYFGHTRFSMMPKCMFVASMSFHNFEYHKLNAFFRSISISVCVCFSLSMH